jgi:hypothetical protein
MADENKDLLDLPPLLVPGWGRGIVTSFPATEIPDDAAQDILNMEFDDSDNLSCRNGLTQLFSTTFANRITSLYYFTSGAGEIGILYTTAAQLRIVETNGTGDTNLTGALTLPNNTFWQWITYKDIAIGVNKASSGDNPVKVSTGAVAAALGGSPPKGKYIALWENRVWIVSATEPNQLWGSKLGDPENWTTGVGAGDAITLDVELDDGDTISGLFATRDALYIKKTKRIYKIVKIDQNKSITDQTNLKVAIHSQTIGCVSPYSIQPILDDVIYLSEQGLASLKLSEVTEDFRTALYSRNVAEIAKINKITDEIPSLLLPNVNQYWLSIPAAISTRQIDEVYVLDFLNIQRGIDAARWTRFSGLAAFTAATSFIGGTGRMYVIGAKNAGGTYQIYTYRPKTSGGTFSDNGVAYSKLLRTKAYVANLPLIRKHWRKWGFAFDLETNSAQVSIKYFLDSNITKGGSYAFTLNASTLGALWDQAIWDVDSWDTAVEGPVDIVRKLLTNSSGQRSQSITFEVSNSQNGEGYTIKDFLLIYSMLSELKVTEI